MDNDTKIENQAHSPKDFCFFTKQLYFHVSFLSSQWLLPATISYPTPPTLLIFGYICCDQHNGMK